MDKHRGRRSDADTSERARRVMPGSAARRATAPRAFGTSSQPGAEVVVRQSLLRRLAGVDDRVPLITLAAPAGYGKTTALSQWAAADRRRFVYLRLEPAHNDDRRLLDDLARAVSRVRTPDEAPRRPPGNRDPLVPDAAVPQIVAAVRALGRPVVLILDDAHQLQGARPLAAILRLVRTVPSGCHVVLAGRCPPRIRIGGIRSEGRCIELGPADLAFSVAETHALLHQLGVDLPDASVEVLVRSAEGWPAVVLLGALSLRGMTALDTEPVEQVVSGDRGDVSAYVRRVGLARQAPTDLDFLVRTSVLEHLSAPLCDAVLRSTDSAARLAELEASNLFLIPQDGRGQRYRYHGLFARLLTGELRRRLPGEESRLLRRAAAWCEAHGGIEQGVAYALRADDPRTAARLIAAHVQELHAAGRIHVARPWLRALPDSVLREYPPCAIAALWVWALTGDPVRARRCLRIAESAEFPGPMPDGSASFASALARARALLCPDGVGVMLRDARRASELEPPGSDWYTMAQVLLGTAQLLTGSPDPAGRSFEQAAHLAGNRARPGACYALAQLSLLAAEHGEWASAAARVAESHEKTGPASLGGNLSSLFTYVAGARTAFEDGHDQAALVQLHKALRLYADPSPRAVPWLGAHAAVVLGHLLLDLGDAQTAQQMAADSARYLAVLGEGGLLLPWHQALVGRLARARNRESATRAAGLTAAESRVLELLPTHGTLSDIAHRFDLSTNTVKSQVSAIYRKLGVMSRRQAVQKAVDLGLLEPRVNELPGTGTGTRPRPSRRSRLSRTG